jgi:agmatinase
MNDVDMLALLLRPAGGGVHTVSTGKGAQLALQRRLYGAADAAGVEAKWRAALAGIASARVAVVAVPSDTGAGLVRGAASGPAALRAAILDLVPDFSERAGRAGIVDVGDVFVVPQLLHDEMLSAAQLAATRAAIYPTTDAAVRAGLPVSPLSMAEAVAACLYRLNPGSRSSRSAAITRWPGPWWPRSARIARADRSRSSIPTRTRTSSPSASA